MTRFLRLALFAVIGASVLAADGCTGRRGSIPEIATVAPYNGAWTIEAASPTRQRVQFASEDGYGFTSVTGQLIAAVMGMRVERFVLDIGDSFFRVSSGESGFSFSLPIDGTPILVSAEDGAVEQSMTLAWDEGTPVVGEHSLAPAGFPNALN